MTDTAAQDKYGVDLEACRARQRRVIAELERLDAELAIVTQIEHVQYLAGPRFPWVFSPCAALSLDGRLTLVAPEAFQGPAAADEIVPYEAKSFSTLRNDQRLNSSQALLRALGAKTSAPRVAVEFSTCGPCLTSKFSGELVDVEPALYRLRRQKDPDELARLKKAIAGTGAMYARAREIIQPGINELDVFDELQAAAVREFGEMLTGTGNDYCSGEHGGPPRDRAAQAGELYILDLGPAFRGYFADNCRTFAVSGRPTDAQQRVWESIVPVFAHVEREVKPGKSCRQLFFEVKEMLDTAARPLVFNHHLGHGIGLFPHEAPHLNPKWDDTFQVGEVFAVEPGLYAPELRVGIRLENNYLVAEKGVELLSKFPLELSL